MRPGTNTNIFLTVETRNFLVPLKIFKVVWFETNFAKDEASLTNLGVFCSGHTLGKMLFATPGPHIIYT